MSLEGLSFIQENLHGVFLQRHASHFLPHFNTFTSALHKNNHNGKRTVAAAQYNHRGLHWDLLTTATVSYWLKPGAAQYNHSLQQEQLGAVQYNHSRILVETGSTTTVS